MIALLVFGIVSSYSPCQEAGPFGTMFHRGRLAREEAALTDALRRLESRDPRDREAIAIRLLDHWLCLDPRRDEARELIASFDFADPSLMERAPRLVAHRFRADGDLARAHEWEDRAQRVDGFDPRAALLVAIELKTLATTDVATTCSDLVDRVRAAAPDHSIPLWFAVDLARHGKDCGSAVEWLDDFAERAIVDRRFADACWAHGLAAELEARDLSRPRSAADRCRRLLTIVTNSPLEVRASEFVDWYSRSVVESTRAEERRERLAMFAKIAATSMLVLLLSLTAPSMARAIGR